MGGAVSSGADNDELIDNLHAADYIRTELVERVFRAVDRGEYILPEFRMNAYKDQAWRYNHLHLSAPCIYSEVMEGLNLMPGISFLNLGSGTGYLSTMVGLLLGSNGINHGIEYYDDVIIYANKKLEEFKKYSGAIDEFEFCEPKFMKGNCLCLTSERQYDRIYVGAGCPESYESYLKNLLRVGGILVMPLNEQLLQIKRISSYGWTVASLLPVSFSMLIVPPTKENVDLVPIEPQSLQTICRSLIRNTLRRNIDAEMPDLKCRKKNQQNQRPPKRNRKPNQVENVMIPITEAGRRESFFDIENEDDVREYLSFVLERAVDERTSREDIEGNESIFNSSDDSPSDDDDETNMETSSNPAENAEAMELEHREPGSSTLPSQSNTSSGTHTTRQKIDSGIGDESHSDDVMSCQGDNNEECDNGSKRLLKTENVGCKWRRIDKSLLDNDTDSASSSDNDDDLEDSCPSVALSKRRTVDSPYTRLMFDKIMELPLPPILRDYVNFHRF